MSLWRCQECGGLTGGSDGAPQCRSCGGFRVRRVGPIDDPPKVVSVSVSDEGTIYVYDDGSVIKSWTREDEQGEER